MKEFRKIKVIVNQVWNVAEFDDYSGEWMIPTKLADKLLKMLPSDTRAVAYEKPGPRPEAGFFDVTYFYIPNAGYVAVPGFWSETWVSDKDLAKAYAFAGFDRVSILRIDTQGNIVKVARKGRHIGVLTEIPRGDINEVYEFKLYTEVPVMLNKVRRGQRWFFDLIGGQELEEIAGTNVIVGAYGGGFIEYVNSVLYDRGLLNIDKMLRYRKDGEAFNLIPYLYESRI